jgi:hypothetical protein
MNGDDGRLAVLLVGGRKVAGVGLSSVAKQIPKPKIGRDRPSLLSVCMSRGPKDQPSLRPVASTVGRGLAAPGGA